MFFWR